MCIDDRAVLHLFIHISGRLKRDFVKLLNWLHTHGMGDLVELSTWGT